MTTKKKAPVVKPNSLEEAIYQLLKQRGGMGASAIAYAILTEDKWIFSDPDNSEANNTEVLKALYALKSQERIRRDSKKVYNISNSKENEPVTTDELILVKTAVQKHGGLAKFQAIMDAIVTLLEKSGDPAGAKLTMANIIALSAKMGGFKRIRRCLVDLEKLSQ